MGAKWTAMFLLLMVADATAWAGGAWLPGAGHGTLYTGFSRKTANTSWDSSGDSFRNTGRYENHDFRYLYLDGEVGLTRRFSAVFLFTYLDGREGPTGELRQNTGPSDTWLGLKMQLTDGTLKSALRLSMRTAELYDIDGPYSSELYDDEGEFVSYSPEWRGLLKEDYTLEGVLSRSFEGGRYWAIGSTGYTYRAGAPADQVPVYLEAGRWFRSGKVALKLESFWVFSLGNDSARQPDDRFGSRPGFNFNDASMGRLGVSAIVPLDRRGKWSLTVGYNTWVWGRSARQYDEPFFNIGRMF
jgi:hypothetical protein